MRRDGAHQRRGVAALWADLRRRIDKAAYARQNAEGEFEGRQSRGRPRRSWPATLSPCTSGISRPCERSPRSATSPPPYLSEAIEKNNQVIGAAHAARET